MNGKVKPQRASKDVEKGQFLVTLTVCYSPYIEIKIDGIDASDAVEAISKAVAIPKVKSWFEPGGILQVKATCIDDDI